MRSSVLFVLTALSCFGMTARAFEVHQVLRGERLVDAGTNIRPVQPIDEASWIGLSGDVPPPPPLEESVGAHVVLDGGSGEFFLFRRDFDFPGGELRFDVSADERFTLLLDGKAVARGPHRSIPSHWYYETYSVSGLEAGPHRLEAVVQRLRGHAPLAQTSWRGGSFILKADGVCDSLLTTGKSQWKAARLYGTVMTPAKESHTFGAGSACVVSGTDILHEAPEDAAFLLSEVVRGPVMANPFGIRTPGWRLHPTERPDTIHERRTPGGVVAVRTGGGFAGTWRMADASDPRTGAFESLLKSGAPLVVPTNSSACVLWDLGDYFCAYPELRVSGGRGTVVRWGWTESLRDSRGRKSDRDKFDGLCASQAFIDEFRPDGRSAGFFSSPWWRCGKWCVLSIETSGEPLVVESLSVAETRYPLSIDGFFRSDDPSLSEIWGICRRGMEMCANEMLFDCPYYEQQMYPGDTRIQLLVMNALTRDDRMTRFAMGIYDHGRTPDGQVGMNYPTRAEQASSTYTLCWVLMFRDYMMWHDNEPWLRARMPGARSALWGMEAYAGPDGLLRDLPGWSFMDHTFGKNGGSAPEGQAGQGVSAANNLLYVLALRSVADVEDALGEAHMAARWRERADRVSESAMRVFWDEGRGLVADTPAHDCFSEHAQCLAILSGVVVGSRRDAAFRGLIDSRDLVRASSYFSHYLFETYAACGRMDLFFPRLETWRNYLAHGLKTPCETDSLACRSDCHAWSSSPIYHFAANVAGIRPDAPFFRKVEVAPQPGALGRVDVRVPHPNGTVDARLSFAEGGVSGSVTLPAGVDGTFRWRGRSIALTSGRNEISAED